VFEDGGFGGNDDVISMTYGELRDITIILKVRSLDIYLKYAASYKFHCHSFFTRLEDRRPNFPADSAGWVQVR